LTDWIALKEWLKLSACPELERLHVHLFDATPERIFGDKILSNNLKDLQNRWNVSCMTQDRDIKLYVHNGEWHLFNFNDPDVFILLNPGFHAFVDQWYPTLQKLTNVESPLVVTGLYVDYMDPKTIATSIDDKIYNKRILELFGFSILHEYDNPFKRIDGLSAEEKVYSQYSGLIAKVKGIPVPLRPEFITVSKNEMRQVIEECNHIDFVEQCKQRKFSDQEVARLERRNEILKLKEQLGVLFN
jgi:hypothetical protein